MPTDKELAAVAADAAFSDIVKTATSQYFNCVISAKGDAQEQADCITRYETGLKTFKAARKTSGDTLNQVFP